MKARAIGLATITNDRAEAEFLHDKLLDVVKLIPHERFSYFSVYSTEADEDLEIVAEGAEDGLETVTQTLYQLGYTEKETEFIIDAIHGVGVIFRKLDQ